MPYTPPSHRSPASSASISRRPSLQSGSRPSLSRSASYLNKHRQTPSVTAVSDGSTDPLTPQGTLDDLQFMVAGVSSSSSGSIRQSPSPLTARRGMPKGAVISLADSASSRSDDEDSTPEIRGRNVDRLKDLKLAVSQISEARTPAQSARKGNNATAKDGPPSRGLQFSVSISSLGDLPNASRKSSHVQLATEPHTPLIQSTDNSMIASEEDTDEDLGKKPQMVRKKSGELVRPALRPSRSRGRPSSMPGTPIFSKAVHFDYHLEHVRHFLQVDRSLAVSAGSPVDSHDSDTEYHFPRGDQSASESPPFEWEILTANFPLDSLARRTLLVRLEKVWMSGDQKSMLGSIAVANLAFHKYINCRFTLDYWETTSEVSAGFSHEILPRNTPMGYDCFNVSIKLSDTVNLESKTLFFCIRYSVNGQEFWDNNGSANFQVDFRKKHLPQNGKNGIQGAASRPVNGLPRSNHRQNPPIALRSKSIPVALDGFGNEGRLNFDQPIHGYLGETGPAGLRFKSRSSSNTGGDNIGKGSSSPSGAVFANRYDYGAAVQAATTMAPPCRPPKTPRARIKTACT
jgi:hypothetical protein